MLIERNVRSSSMPIHESMTIVQRPPFNSFRWHVFGFLVCPIAGMRISTIKIKTRTKKELLYRLHMHENMFGEIKVSTYVCSIL